MSQNDFVIDNGTGLAVRQDIESAFQALASNNSGSTTPSTTYAYQFWADTSAATLKIRNSANNDWIELLQLDGTLTLEDGSASAPALGFRDDLDTGIFSGGANEFNIATGGTERFVIDSSGNCGIGTQSASGKLHIAEASTNTGGDINANGDGLIVDNSGGNTGLTFKTPNSASSRICFGDPEDNNVGQILYNHSTDDLTITAADNIVLDGDNVGVNTSSPAGVFHVNLGTDKNIVYAGNISEIGNLTGFQATNDAQSSLVGFGMRGSEIRFAIGSSESMRLDSNGDLEIMQSKKIIFVFAGGSTHRGSITADSSDAMKFTTGSSDTERMRIDSSGNVLIGTTSIDGDGLSIRPRQADGTTRLNFNRADTSDNGTVLQFLNNDSTVGTIKHTNSATSYNTSSDYRLKENAVAISDGITRLKTLKPYRFNFKVDASTKVDGFFAHEVTAVPEAISGEKDAVKEDGSIDPQAIDLSKLVPLLVAAVQELITKVETLEAA